MDHNTFLNTYQRLSHGDQRYHYPIADYQPMALSTGFSSKGLAGAFLASVDLLLDEVRLDNLLKNAHAALLDFDFGLGLGSI